ncbi:MAG: PAS domain-containing protein [Verrucomicrobiota bacterium]
MNATQLAFFDSMPFMVVIRNRNGEYVYANNAVVELAGQEVVGHTDDDMPWSQHKKDFSEQDAHVFNSGESKFIFEYTVHDRFTGESVRLHYCKWLDEFEGEECVFALAMPILD